MPVRMFISVDLPAPFSPRRAWISPRRSSRSTPSLAVTAPKRLTMPRSSRASSAAPDVEDAVGAGLERVVLPRLDRVEDRRVDALHRAGQDVLAEEGLVG